MRKKFFSLAILCMVALAAVGCGKTDEERFYEKRDSLNQGCDLELAVALEEAYCKAVEEDGIEVEKDFISVRHDNSSLDSCMIFYHVLSTDGKYYIYDVATPSEEELFWTLYSGTEGGRKYIDIIPRNEYYVKKGEIRLQQ